MKTLELQVRPEAGAKEIKFTFRMPETTVEFAKVYGEEVANSLLKQQVTIGIQGFARNKLNAKTPVKPGADLQKAVDAWKPGVRAGGVSRIEKLKDRLAKLTDEERAALGLPPGSKGKKA